MRMPPRGQTRISSSRADFSGAYKLSVPAPVARMVGPEALFQVELVDDGILYRYVDGELGDVPQMPKWLRKD